MSKSTSLAQLQNNSGDMDGSMTDVEEVMNQLGNGNQEEYFEQQQMAPQNAQQAQMMAAQQQQAQMMAAQQQQQAQMMAAQEQQAQMMAAHQLQQQQAQMMGSQPPFAQKNSNALLPTNTKQQSFVEKVMGELKDSLLVLIVFVLLNFKPVNKIVVDLLGKFTQNDHILLLVRGVIAGVLFYVVRRLILNQ
jgi:ATPase subunit of ABC transporter with duplicated ATPase domains